MILIYENPKQKKIEDSQKFRLIWIDDVIPSTSDFDGQNQSKISDDFHKNDASYRLPSNLLADIKRGSTIDQLTLREPRDRTYAHSLIKLRTCCFDNGYDLFAISFEEAHSVLEEWTIWDRTLFLVDMLNAAYVGTKEDAIDAAYNPNYYGAYLVSFYSIPPERYKFLTESENDPYVRKEVCSYLNLRWDEYAIRTFPREDPTYQGIKSWLRDHRKAVETKNSPTEESISKIIDVPPVDKPHSKVFGRIIKSIIGVSCATGITWFLSTFIFVPKTTIDSLEVILSTHEQKDRISFQSPPDNNTKDLPKLSSGSSKIVTIKCRGKSDAHFTIYIIAPDQSVEEYTDSLFRQSTVFLTPNPWEGIELTQTGQYVALCITKSVLQPKIGNTFAEYPRKRIARTNSNNGFISFSSNGIVDAQGKKILSQGYVEQLDQSLNSLIQNDKIHDFRGLVFEVGDIGK
ncbi:MAG: hypothetical protein AB7V04_10215 [Desulfomonilaceae bacterium]